MFNPFTYTIYYYILQFSVSPLWPLQSSLFHFHPTNILQLFSVLKLHFTLPPIFCDIDGRGRDTSVCSSPFWLTPFLPLFNVSVDHGHIHLWGKITSDGHPTFLLFKPFLPGHLLIASLPTCQLKSAPINTSFSPVEPHATSSTFFCEKVYFFCNCCSTWHQLVLLTLHTNTQQKIPTNFYLLFLMTSYSSLPSPVIFFLHLNWCLWPWHFIWSFFTT